MDTDIENRIKFPSDKEGNSWERRGVKLARVGKVEFTGLKSTKDGVNFNPPRSEISEDGELGSEKKSESNTAFVIWFDDDTVWDGRDIPGQSFEIKEFLFDDEIEEYYKFKQEHYDDANETSESPVTLPSITSRNFVVRRLTQMTRTLIAIDDSTNTYVELKPVDKIDYRNFTGAEKKETDEAWRGMRLPITFEPDKSAVLIPDEFGFKLNTSRYVEDPKFFPLLYTRTSPSTYLPKTLLSYFNTLLQSYNNRFFHTICHHLVNFTKPETAFLFIGASEQQQRILIRLLTHIYGNHMTTVLAGEDRISSDTTWMSHSLVTIWQSIEGSTPSATDKIHTRISALMTADRLVPRSPQFPLDEVDNRSLVIMFNDAEPKRHNIASFDRINIIECNGKEVDGFHYIMENSLRYASNLFAFLHSITPDPNLVRVADTSEFKEELASKKGTDIDVYNRGVISDISNYILEWSDRINNPTSSQPIPKSLRDAVARNIQVIEQGQGYIYFTFQELALAYTHFSPIVRHYPELTEAKGVRRYWRELRVSTSSKYIDGKQIRAVFWSYSNEKAVIER